MQLKGSQSPPDRPSGPNIRALLALNAALLGLLAVVTLAPTVDAQGRGRGEYTMVAGGVNGADSSAVYIVDAANQELMVVAYNQNTKRLDGVGYRNLAADAANLPGRTQPGS